MNISGRPKTRHFISAAAVTVIFSTSNFIVPTPLATMPLFRSSYQAIPAPGWKQFALPVMLVALGTLAHFANAVTFSVTPSALSNNYSGVLTLQITGLTNGEHVIIQRYLDLNGNGTGEATEPLLDTFTIADGGVSTIGGITNVNV